MSTISQRNKMPVHVLSCTSHRQIWASAAIFLSRRLQLSASEVSPSNAILENYTWCRQMEQSFTYLRYVHWTLLIKCVPSRGSPFWQTALLNTRHSTKPCTCCYQAIRTTSATREVPSDSLWAIFATNAQLTAWLKIKKRHRGEWKIVIICQRKIITCMNNNIDTQGPNIIIPGR